MDCNLPELLARDLEMSKAVFLAKHMTAGAPRPDLAASHSRSLPPDFGNSNPVRAAQYRHILTTIRSLGELEQWSCSKLEDPVENQNDESVHEAGPSPDSTSESSVGMEAPGLHFREPSVTTAPTSVTSRRCSSPLQTPPLPAQLSKMDKNPQDSWVDLTPEETTLRESSEEPLLDEPQSIPSPTSIDRDDSAIMEGNQVRTGAASEEGGFTPFHLPVGYGSPGRPRTSPGGGAPREKPHDIDTKLPYPVPKKKATQRQPRSSSEPAIDRDESHKSPCESAGDNASVQAADERCINSPTSIAHATTCDSCGTAVDPTFPVDEPEYQNKYYAEAKTVESPPNSEDASQEVSQEASQELSEENDFSMEEPPKHISSPRQQVHKLAKPSSGIELSPLLSRHPERLAPGIPLPPEVTETLRISVVCFPETMLLSSSLTIETIRSYSKKFRHNDNQSGGDGGGPDNQSVLSFDTSAAEPNKRWKKLPSLLSPRRIAPSKLNWPKQALAPTTPHRVVGLSEAGGASSSPNWSSLKNIFPMGSDYLCDALYAHLVAYNYISNICANGTGPNPDGAADTEEGGPSSPIPKKAATLLGLSGVVSGASKPRLTIGGGARKRFGGGKDGGVMVSRSPPNDPSMRELLGGLGKCISQLIATLRLTSGSQGSDSLGIISSPKAEGAVETDGLLLRALCEVVRSSEETR